MAKAKRKRREGQRHAAQAPADVSLAKWDQGATGPANRHNLKTEDRGEIDPETGRVTNPNGVKGVRRIDMLEFWHDRGTISTEGFNAAEKLRNAYEETLRGQSWPDSERVHSSPKPDKAVAIQIDRLSGFTALSKHIHPDDKAIITACVLEQGTPYQAGYKRERYKRGLERLRQALDRLADSFARRS